MLSILLDIYMNEFHIFDLDMKRVVEKIHPLALDRHSILEFLVQSH